MSQTTTMSLNQLKNAVFTTTKLSLMLLFDQEQRSPMIAAVPKADVLPLLRQPGEGVRIPASQYDRLQDDLPASGLFAYTDELRCTIDPSEHAYFSKLGFRILSSDASIPLRNRIVSAEKVSCGMVLPVDNFEAAAGYGIQARSATGFSPEGIHLVEFIVIDPAKAFGLHPILGKCVPGTQVLLEIDGMPNEFKSMLISGFKNIQSVGGIVYLADDRVYFDTADIVLEAQVRSVDVDFVPGYASQILVTSKSLLEDVLATQKSRTPARIDILSDTLIDGQTWQSFEDSTGEWDAAENEEFPF